MKRGNIWVKKTKSDPQIKIRKTAQEGAQVQEATEKVAPDDRIRPAELRASRI